jgi:hypothetical protein
LIPKNVLRAFGTVQGSVASTFGTTVLAADLSAVLDGKGGGVDGACVNEDGGVGHGINVDGGGAGAAGVDAAACEQCTHPTNTCWFLTS